jgi:hypothetical protein
MVAWKGRDRSWCAPNPIRFAVQFVARGDPAHGDDVCALSLLFEEGGGPAALARIDICHETVRFWWNCFGPLFPGDIRRRRLRAGNFSRWHVDEVFVKVNGEVHYVWRAVDHQGEVAGCEARRIR